MSILPLLVLLKCPVGLQVGEGKGGGVGGGQQAQAPWRIQLHSSIWSVKKVNMFSICNRVKRRYSGDDGLETLLPSADVHAFIASMTSKCVKGRSTGRDCADLLQARDGNLGLSRMGSKMQIQFTPFSKAIKLVKVFQGL